MLHSWCTQTVTVIRAPLVTERGASVRDWDNATEHTIAGCSVQPSDSSRDFARREEQSSFGFHAFLPPNADIQAGDRVRCDVGVGGEITFEIDGVPYSRYSPTGRVDSTQVDLRVWDG